MGSQSLSQAAKSAATQGGEALRVLARDIRALRKARGLTLSGLAEQLGRSVGWLSQVERGISLPTVADLRQLANQFSVPVSFFFADERADEKEQNVIVRADSRRLLTSSKDGVAEELLSPDLGGSFQIVRSEFAPGAAMAERTQRATEEAGYVLSGEFEVEIGGVWHRLGTGDSFRFRREPFRWRNPGTEPAIVIRVIAPPVY